MIKLNLGCGHKLMEGFVNCDLPDNWSGKQPDICCDVTAKLPFEDGYADEIHAYHLLEHVWRWKAEEVLKDWMRVLKPGGLLILEMPCLDKIVFNLMHYLHTGKPIDPRMTIWGLYGDPRYKSEAMSHKWCWCGLEVKEVLFGMGWREVNIVEPQTHIPARDMRVEARKQ